MKMLLPLLAALAAAPYAAAISCDSLDSQSAESCDAVAQWGCPDGVGCTASLWSAAACSCWTCEDDSWGKVCERSPQPAPTPAPTPIPLAKCNTFGIPEHIPCETACYLQPASCGGSRYYKAWGSDDYMCSCSKCVGASDTVDICDSGSPLPPTPAPTPDTIVECNDLPANSPQTCNDVCTDPKIRCNSGE